MKFWSISSKVIDRDLDEQVYNITIYWRICVVWWSVYHLACRELIVLIQVFQHCLHSAVLECKNCTVFSMLWKELQITLFKLTCTCNYKHSCALWWPIPSDIILGTTLFPKQNFVKHFLLLILGTWFF